MGGATLRDKSIQHQSVLHMNDISKQIPANAAFILINGRPLSALPADRPILPNDHVIVHGCLPGGKGGFGALLRGLGRDPSKLVDNYDACRDISGRRLRHVAAEAKLRDWKKRQSEREDAKRQIADAKRKQREEELEKEREEIEAVVLQSKAVSIAAKKALSIQPTSRVPGAQQQPTKRRKIAVCRVSLDDSEQESDDSDECEEERQNLSDEVQRITKQQSCGEGGCKIDTAGDSKESGKGRSGVSSGVVSD